MRIIAGASRGIPLKAGKQEAVRPTTDRIKESLFNMLGPLHDARVVDLFAGSGALGLEALSRGASEVHLVESDRLTCKIIQENLTKVSKANGPQSGTCRIVSHDVMQVHKSLPQLRGNIDLILADPPYADACRYAVELLESPQFADWADDAILVLEHTTEMREPENPQWDLTRRKHYGLTVISFYRKKDLS